MSGQFWLTDEQVERLRPHFPKARDKPRVDDRRVLSGILHVLRNGLRWGDAPPSTGRTRPSTTASCAGRGWGCLPGSSTPWPSLAGMATPL